MDDLVTVSGHAHGVAIRGLGPPELGALLRPLPRGSRLVARLDVSFRTIARPPVLQEIWSSEPDEAAGDRFALARLEAPPGLGLLLDSDHGAYYRILKDAIEVEQLADGHSAAVFLLSNALPLWLENRGVPVLHASAVAFGGRAVAFLGPTGVGKSTLAAELVREGCGFVADDGLALRSEGSGWRCFPGPPVCRLWPSALEHRLGLAPSELEPIYAGTEKRAWPIAAGELSAAAGLPLAAIYLLDRRPDGEGEVAIGPINRRSSLAHLIEHSVAAGPTAALGLSASRLEALARIVEAVPIRILELPGGGSTERVLRALLADLEEPALSRGARRP